MNFAIIETYLKSQLLELPQGDAMIYTFLACLSYYKIDIRLLVF